MNSALIRARKDAGKTQRQTANEIGVFLTAYQRYEYDTREPRVRVAIKLAEVFGLSDTSTFSDFKALFPQRSTPGEKDKEVN